MKVVNNDTVINANYVPMDSGFLVSVGELTSVVPSTEDEAVPVVKGARRLGGSKDESTSIKGNNYFIKG